jgi:hypothetical protein
MIDEILNILALFFAASGIVAWLIVAFLIWWYSITGRPK